ncbi:MAG TPA: hypothetical protein VI911_11000 [Patescibacteria group bacterium]|nr:hypothetical protein [Patescibacteria group bacterium]
MADSFDESKRQESEDAIERKVDYLEALGRDQLGSYDRAQKRAYDNALPDDQFALVPGVGVAGNALNIGKRSDYQWIQKVRNIAAIEFENQRKNELNELQAAYNLKTAPTSPIGQFTDIPVRITDALGRDIGASFSRSRNDFASGVASVFGQSGSIAPVVDTADRYVRAAIDDVTKIITESPWIEKRIKSLKDKANKPLNLPDVNSFLGGVNNVFATHFRKVMGDLGDILNEWWHDPRTLCCLIKTLAALALATGKKIGNETGLYEPDAGSFGATYNKIVKKYFTGNAKFSELTGTRDFFDKMIAILKIIRNFLNQDLNFNFALNLDLGLSMSKASIGALMALLTALQQMLEDKIYTKMMEITKKYVREEIRQCIPFEKLLRLLADWMTGPDGLFKYIEQFVDAYMIGFAQNMQYGFDQSAKNKMMDLAALDKLIALLEKLRDSMLNLELCIEADFSKTPELSDDGMNSEKTVGMGPTNYSGLVDQIQGKKPIGNNIVYPTDREIMAFITGPLGESQAFATQVLTSAKLVSDVNVGRAAGSPDNQGAGTAGTDGISMAIGDCARTVNPTRLEEIARLVADWDII